MKKVFAAIFLIGLGMAAMRTYQHFFPSNRIQILHQIAKIEKAFALEESENPLAIARKIRQLDELISSDLEIQFKTQEAQVEITDLQDLKNKAMMARQYFHNLELEFKDIEFTTDLNEAENASVKLTAVVSGKARNAEKKFREASPFIFEFQKQEDAWKLSRLSNEEILSFR